jgi:lysophospholipase L1-like esterase
MWVKSSYSPMLISTGQRWVDIWAATPQLCEPDNLPPPPFITPTHLFPNTTIRQTVKVTLSAETIRLRISNAFGGTDLAIASMSIATPSPSRTSAGSPSIDPTTSQRVTFGGKDEIRIPVGALAVSDAVEHGVNAGESVTMTIYLEKGQGGSMVTSHPGSRTISWLAEGDQTDAVSLADTPIDHWYYISAVESLLPLDRCAFVIIGDSITDGRGSTTNGNDRWSDLVSCRLQEAGVSHIAVINQGAGGNRVLTDGLGPNAWSRITRDVLSHSSVKYAMIFEGVNDIGTADNTIEAQDEIYDRLVIAYQQMVIQIRAGGIYVFGSTIPPFSAPSSSTVQPYSSVLRDRTRRRINRWIVEESGYDYVVDFAKALADPDKDERLLEEYNSGDYLHPSPAGYRKMAETFDLEVFTKCVGEVQYI